eukprot:scaffold8887_cov71-Skeletonema_dohrnii-CCMP3373.AAC.1
MKILRLTFSRLLSRFFPDIIPCKSKSGKYPHITSTKSCSFPLGKIHPCLWQDFFSSHLPMDTSSSKIVAISPSNFLSNSTNPGEPHEVILSPQQAASPASPVSLPFSSPYYHALPVWPHHAFLPTLLRRLGVSSGHLFPPAFLSLSSPHLLMVADTTELASVFEVGPLTWRDRPHRRIKALRRFSEGKSSGDLTRH